MIDFRDMQSNPMKKKLYDSIQEYEKQLDKNG